MYIDACQVIFACPPQTGITLSIPPPYRSHNHQADLYPSQVHTGPAAHLSKINATMNEFEFCINNDQVTQCNIPHFVWSGRSDAKVPVAEYHSWTYNSEIVNAKSVREERSKDALATISNLIATRIKEANRTFTTDGINVELFSAEGIFCFLVLFPIHKWVKKGWT